MNEFETKVIEGLTELKTDMEYVKEDVKTLKESRTPCEKDDIKKDLRDKTTFNRKMIYLLIVSYVSLITGGFAYNVIKIKEVPYGVHKQK